MVSTPSQNGNPTIAFKDTEAASDAPLADPHLDGDGFYARPALATYIVGVVRECEQNDEVSVVSRSELPHQGRQLDAHLPPPFVQRGPVVCCKHHSIPFEP